MRLYSGRILKTNIQQSISLHSESRDAVVYDVDYVNHKCRVKIQGTSVLIVAHFPENWEQTPVWLKPGNAVRISHTGGNRGRIELIGHGMFVPTPVAGDVGAPPVAPETKILTGMTIVACTSGDAVVVMSGTYIITGTPHILPAVGMASYPQYTTPPGLDRSQVAAVIPTGNGYAYRYDIICVGHDGTVDFINGNTATPPLFPTVPTDHLRIGWIFRYNNNPISQLNVNKYYTVSKVSWITASLSADHLTWTDLTATITVNMVNQYNAAMNPSSVWTVQCEIVQGNGTLTNNNNQSSNSLISGDTNSSSITFTYTRILNGGASSTSDISPAIRVTLMGYGYATVVFILLEDSNGDPMV